MGGQRYAKGSLDNGKALSIASNEQQGKTPANAQPATNVFAPSGNHQPEVQYDTYPRRKKKKDKQQQQQQHQQQQHQQKSNSGEIGTSSPLTIIDGNYSFSLSDDKEPPAKLKEK